MLYIKTVPVIIVLLLIMFAGRLPAETHEQEENISLVIRLHTYSTTMTGQSRSVIESIIDVMESKTGLNISVEYINPMDEILEKVAAGEIDFILTIDTELALKLLYEYDFDTSVTFEIFGTPSMNCLFAREESNIESIDDLKQSGALTYQSMLDYFYLRELVGEPPELFFGTLKVFNDPQSGIYALAFEETDAIFIDVNNVNYFKIVNPGPIKNIKQIECFEVGVNTFLFHSRDVPPEIVDKSTDFLMRLKQFDEFKQYRSMINLMDLKVKRITKKDFEKLQVLYEKGKEKGWDKDYESWIKYVKK